MGKCKYYHYFVEGENEEKIVQILKTELQLIVPGKVQVFNVIDQKLTKMRLMSLKACTTVILVFDTDTGNTSTLIENINFLKKQATVKEVICITQVKNLEDELLRSCDVKQIKELTGSKSNSNYKRDMLNDSNFAKKLQKHKFDMSKFRNTVDESYKDIGNDAYKIKL